VAAVKWIFVVLFGLAGAGALGMGFVSGGVSRTPVLTSAPAITLRPFAEGSIGAAAAPKAAEPVAEKPAEPVAEKPAEPAAAKPEPVAAKPEPVAAKPEPVAAKPEPVAAKPEPVAAKPEPVAAKPEPVAAKPPPPPPAEGMLNLRASDTADVYLDGKKLGGSPLLGVKAKVGNHKVRFDCYDAAGNTLTGAAQTVSVKADGETDVEFTCPTE